MVDSGVGEVELKVICEGGCRYEGGVFWCLARATVSWRSSVLAVKLVQVLGFKGL